LAQNEAERLNEELTSKTQEFVKYRRSKQSEFANLQASLDDVTSREQAAQSALKSLHSAHNNQSREHSQALAKIQDLTGRLAEQETTYLNEAATLKRLVSVLEEREQQAKDIVANIEKEWATVGEKADRRESNLREEIEIERRHREEAEKRVDQLELVLQKMGKGELPVPGTPGRAVSVDETTDGMMGLSPTVAIASRSQKSGKTFTEVYADYVRLQEEHARKSTEYDHMERTLNQVLRQIEERVCQADTIFTTKLINNTRLPFSLNNDKSTSACKSNQHSWLQNSPGHCLNAIAKPLWQTRMHTVSQKHQDRMTFSSSNL
jgi:nucleoprotein TPR